MKFDAETHGIKAFKLATAGSAWGLKNQDRLYQCTQINTHIIH
jgi:hypothetical protein